MSIVFNSDVLELINLSEDRETYPVCNITVYHKEPLLSYSHASWSENLNVTFLKTGYCGQNTQKQEVYFESKKEDAAQSLIVPMDKSLSHRMCKRELMHFFLYVLKL